MIIISGKHLHETIERKKQLRGEERRQLAIDVISQTNGQAEAFNSNREANDLINNEKSNVFSNDQVKKAVSEYLNEEMISTSWITNVHHVSDFKPV